MPLHTAILDNSQVFGGVPSRAQWCHFLKCFFSPWFGVVPIWELWQFWDVRIEPPKFMVLSNYILELLHVNPGVDGFLIQLHPEDVDAVLESVTAHAEKGAGTKTTLCVGQEEAEEVEEARKLF